MTDPQRIDIIGTGLGRATMTHEAADLISQADLLIGSDRLLRELGGTAQNVAATRPDKVVRAISSARAQRIAVLMSGDVGFHSGGTKVLGALSAEQRSRTRLIPGVSSPVLLAARLGVPWDDACLVSCHGLDTDLVGSVRRNRHVFALTGGNIHQLAASLIEAGFGDLTVWVGQYLGLESESIVTTTVNGLSDGQWATLTTVMIENPFWDPRVLSGIPDDQFTRGSVPMTKSAVRAFALSRLAIQPTDICYDIGCGTGSVTIELGLAAYEGHVYGIDKEQEAINLTRANCRTFHLGNVTVVEGMAPQAMADWPVPDAVFIGGTSGMLDTVVEAVVRANPNVRLVITAITIETVTAAISALDAHGMSPEVTQLSVATAKAVGEVHMLMGQNPVTVISGEGHG